MTLYIADASSNNGKVNWAAARKDGISAGVEKVTQGNSYVNPLWPEAKTELLREKAAGEFLGGAYMFMDGESSGGTQADYFLEHAGDLSEMFIMVDVERVAGLSVTINEAMDAVRVLKRKLGKRKPIVGYPPHWYTGNSYLGFFDVMVASSYVSGTGRMEDLYARVPASWWREYGQKKVDLLQFSPSVKMAGFPEPSDCSAYRGTFAELKHLLLGVTVTDGMGFKQEATGEKSLLEVAHDRGATVGHIVHTTRNKAGISAAHLEKFNAYYDDGAGVSRKMPKGLVFFTSKSGTAQ